MRIIVTGAAGFIGKALSTKLESGGHEVIRIDPVWEMPPIPKVPIDALVHLGGMTGVRASIDKPDAYIQGNVGGTLDWLELCRVRGVPRFILASTSSVYGDRRGPCREDTDTSFPLSPYAASKKAAEVLAHSYHHLHNLDVTVLRYFTVYGPGSSRSDMAIPRFIKGISEGKRITVYGDGSQRRDFTYIDDIVDGTIAALELKGFHTINLGSGHPYRVLDVIHQIAQECNRVAQIDFEPAHRCDVAETWASTGLAAELLGWKPKVSMGQGLRACVEAYLKDRVLA